MSENDLAIQQQRPIIHNITQELMSVAKVLAPSVRESRHFGGGVTKEEVALVIMLKGYELGFGLLQSFEFIHPIKNQLCISPRGALALALSSGVLSELKIEEVTKGNSFHGYSITGSRRDGVIVGHTETFTLDDAKAAGLIKKDSAWVKWPKNMCKWRCAGFFLDYVCPEAAGGMKRVDEISNVGLTPEGDVIEGELVPATPVHERINEMVSEHGLDKVLSANDGKMPMTHEEIDKLTTHFKEKENEADVEISE